MHRTFVMLLLGISSLAAFGSSQFVARAQRTTNADQFAVVGAATLSGGSQSGSVRGASLSITVNGEQNPERIPDSLAFRHFILATAKRVDASPEQVDRRESLIREIGFSKEDHDSFVKALAGVREQLDQIASERRRWQGNQTPAAIVSLRELKQQETSVVENATHRLETVFSWEGTTQLLAYVREHVKRRIVIYGHPAN